jgi:hypothetical protein
VCGGAAGARDTGAPPGRERRRTVWVSTPGGGQAPGGVTRGWPGASQPREGLGGQGDGPVWGAVTTMALDLEALAIAGRDRAGEGGREPEAQTLDGGAVHVVVDGGGGCQAAPDVLHTQHGGERGGGWRAQEREGGPGALADVRGDEAEAAGADAPGRWGEAVDVFPVPAVTLQCPCREAGGGGVGALSQQASCTDLGLLGTRSCATAWPGGHHGWTSWGQELSPFVR